jgi:pre-mRNA-splicing factor SYF1
MPSTVANSPTLESLSSFFPLTFPIPNPVTHPYLVSTADWHREEDLLRNPTSFHGWWVAISTARDAFTTLRKKQSHSDNIPPNVSALLGPLATPLARSSLQRLTYLYESALSNFPTSFKMWKAYLQMRMSFVLGQQVIKKRTGGRKKWEEMKEALEEEKEGYMEEWQGGLNGIVGLEEWKSLAATFERALMHLPNVTIPTQPLHYI